MSNNPIVWQELFDLSKDDELRQAIETLKKFDQVYTQIIKNSGTMKNEYAKNLRSVASAARSMNKELEKMAPTTEAGKKAIVDVNTKADLLSVTFKDLKGKTAALEGTTMKLRQEKAKLSKATEKLTKLEQEELRLKNKLKTLDSARGQEVAKLREQIIKKNAEMKREAKEALGLISIYQKEARQLVELRTRYKDVALQYGVNSREARRLRNEVTKLDQKLKMVDASAGQHQRSVGNYRKAWSGLGTTMRSVAGAMGFAGAAFAVVSIFRNGAKAVADFDKEMTNLAAISGKTRDQMEGVEYEIRRVAKTSINTANEVAKTATALKTLGKTDTEIVSLLQPVNNLAIALQAPADEAGELLVKTLNAFGESSDAADRYADVIAKMRTSTALDFQRIVDSMSFLAPTAKAVGLTVERTGAILGTLVDNGIKAARAGRLMSSSFARLTDKGLSLEEALEMVQGSTNKTKTASDLFGKEAFTLGLILADNTQKVNDYDQAFQDAAGTLDDLTEKQLASLTAKTQILGSAWQEFVLSIDNGTGAIGRFVGGMLEGLTGIITLITGIENGSISLAEGMAALANPVAMVSTLHKIAAEEALKAAEAEERAASIKRQAEHLYQEAIENGMDTFAEYEKRGAKAIASNVNATEILAEIQKLYVGELEKTPPAAEATHISLNTLKATVSDLNGQIAAAARSELPELVTQLEAAEKAVENWLKQGQMELAPEMAKKGAADIADAYGTIPETVEKVTVKTGSKLSQWLAGYGSRFTNWMEKFGRDAEAVMNNVFGFFNNIAERANQKDAMRIEQIKERSNELLEQADGNAKLMTRIEENRDKSIEALELKMAQRRRRMAIFDKSIRIAQAIMETAFWVTKYGVVTPQAILAGAVGATKVAAIAAEPIPQYFVGTQNHPGGPAIIGEMGRELVKEPGRDPYIQTGPDMVNLPKGTKVFTNMETERMLGQSGVQADRNNESARDVSKAIQKERAAMMSAGLATIMARETDMTVQGIKDAVKDIPVTIWDVSQGDLRKSVRKGNTTYRNVENENSY